MFFRAGDGESGAALPVADAASRFQGSAPFGGHECGRQTAGATRAQPSRRRGSLAALSAATRTRAPKRATGTFFSLRSCPVRASARVIPKRNTILSDGVSFWNDAGRGSNRARAKREKRAGGTFWCPRACRGAQRRERASSPPRLCGPRCASRLADTFVSIRRGAALKPPRCICHRQRSGGFPVPRKHHWRTDVSCQNTLRSSRDFHTLDFVKTSAYGNGHFYNQC